MKKTILIAGCLLTAAAILPAKSSFFFPWLGRQPERQYDRIGNIPLPDGYIRTQVSAGSFQDWLRHLPLKRSRANVRLYNHQVKRNQKNHYGIINMDVGSKNLQQCADSIIRLYAEYLYAQGNYDAIAFYFTNGVQAEFTRWIEGYRPQMKDDRSYWIPTAERDLSYASFRNFLETVFYYAGTYSLSRELKEVRYPDNIQAGDVFVRGGFPGHGVIVVDVAVNPVTRQKIFIMAQGSMPAQDIQILINPKDDALSPWYLLDTAKSVDIPKYSFDWNNLRRFPD